MAKYFVIRHITVKAKQIQPDDGIKKGPKHVVV